MNTGIKEKVRAWQSETFESSFGKHLKKYDPDIVEMVRKIVCSEDYLDLGRKCIDGYAFENLPKTQEGNTYNVRFSGAFHQTREDVDFDPVLYLLELTKRVSEKYPKAVKNKRKLEGFLARSLRSLTSFLREPAFAQELQGFLNEFEGKLSIELTAELDAVDHTDIKVDFRDQTFRIWIFQFSRNGLPHDIERISGLRGALPEGIHILCPMKSEPAMRLGTLKKQIERKQALLLIWREKSSKVKNKTTQTYQKLLDQIARGEDFIKERQSRIDTIYKETEHDLEVINGCFFYPSSYVKSVAMRIADNENHADRYGDILKVFEEPRNYLSCVNFFKV